VIVDFIREHANHPEPDGLRWGVQPICAVLTEHGVQIAPSTYYEWSDKLPTSRARRDAALLVEIRRVFTANRSVYGPRKVWLQLNREGVPVARCTIERLMRADGLVGARRGGRKRTTIADPAAALPQDLVRRDFEPLAPNRLWVADLTYVSTWTGWVYVAFVIDAYARRILGWRVATTITTSMVLDALEQAIWTRHCEGHDDFTALVAHTDHGVQGSTPRSATANASRSPGSLPRSARSARATTVLAETINGLYKTEVIRHHGPWRGVDQVEHATAEWVDWFNISRLFEYCGDIPPVELETAHYHQNQPPTEAA